MVEGMRNEATTGCCVSARRRGVATKAATKVQPSLTRVEPSQIQVPAQTGWKVPQEQQEEDCHRMLMSIKKVIIKTKHITQGEKYRQGGVSSGRISPIKPSKTPH